MHLQLSCLGWVQGLDSVCSKAIQTVCAREPIGDNQATYATWALKMFYFRAGQLQNIAGPMQPTPTPVAVLIPVCPEVMLQFVPLSGKVSGEHWLVLRHLFSQPVWAAC